MLCRTCLLILFVVVNISCSNDDNKEDDKDDDNSNQEVVLLSEIKEDDEFTAYISELIAPQNRIVNTELANLIYANLQSSGTYMDISASDKEMLAEAFGFASIEDFESTMLSISEQSLFFYDKYELQNQPKDSLTIYLKPIIQEINVIKSAKHITTKKVVNRKDCSIEENAELMRVGVLDELEMIDATDPEDKNSTCAGAKNVENLDLVIEFWRDHGTEKNIGACFFPDMQDQCVDEVLDYFIRRGYVYDSYACCLIEKYELDNLVEPCCEDFIGF